MCPNRPSRCCPSLSLRGSLVATGLSPELLAQMSRAAPLSRRKMKKAPKRGAFHDAPKRTRTSTGESPHKALNLARLPIPPPARERRRTIGRGGRAHRSQISPDPDIVRMAGRFRYRLRRAPGARAAERDLALDAQLELLHRLAAVAEYRDDDSGQHIYRVAWMSARLARGLAR